MAWWLAYEELYGDMDKEYPIMNKNDDDMVILGGTDEGKGDGADSIDFNQSWWEGDGFSVTGNPFGNPFTSPAPDTLNITGSRVAGAMGEDHISFDRGAANTAYDDNKYYADGYDPYPTVGSLKPQPNLKYKSQKYGEDKGIADLKDYVSSTYQGHYTNGNSDVQTLDLIHSVGDAESFCRSNALKYLSRYDKKGTAKRDILKAMHYCLLLYYFNGNTNDEITTRGYETF